jgi:5-methylthioadenosine/S-adenosylhomocysteine deaminase
MTDQSFVINRVHIIDSEGELQRDRLVRIAGGRISAVEDAVPHGSEVVNKGAELIDGSGCVLTPGLVNLHTHTPMNIFRGISEDVDADTWFNRDIWPYESKLEEGDIRVGSMLAMAEMIDNGVTACADHYFSPEVICKAALETGIKLDIAPTLFGPAGDFSGQLAATEALYEAWNGYGGGGGGGGGKGTGDGTGRGRGGQISVRFGPHSPYLCSPEELKLTAAAARRIGAGVHIHLAETREKVEESLRKRGKTPYEVIRDAGFFDLPLIIGHGIFITESDRKLVNPELTTMALCPKTYLKLGMGVGNILDRIDELPAAIGTDGAASSNTLDPLEQARILALLGKDRAGTGASWDAKTIWKILMRGHRALPFGSGEIAVKAPADLVLWDLHGFHTAPAYNPLSALLYSAGSREVRSVWINGELKKRDGKLLLDEKGILREAADRVQALMRRGRGETKLVF